MYSGFIIAEKTAKVKEIGYRHIDTAQAYGNERGVGEGVRICGIPREELFVVSKVAAEHKTYQIPYLRTKMPTLWTNSYFVSTVGGAPLEVIKQYIENQKTSQRQKDKQG